MNTFAWLAVHLGAAWGVTQLDPRHFDPSSWLFRERRFERGGALYQQLFRVEAWKRVLPDGARLFRRGFHKKHLRSRSPEYLARFRVETCRGETAHWLVVSAAPLFFLWSSVGVGFLMLGYALLASVPFVVAQRYNRCRLNRVLGVAARAAATAAASSPRASSATGSGS